MAWYELLIPSALTALLIRLDSFLIGPYWALSELVAGMGGVETWLSYERGRVRWAVIRRFAYPLLLAILATILRPQYGLAQGALYGGVTAALLLWPIVFVGLPVGVLKRDWWLAPLYGGFLLAFVGGGALGAVAVNTARLLADGNLAEYASEQVFVSLATAGSMLIGAAFFNGAKSRLAERKRKRDEIGYETIAEEGDPFA